MPLKMENRDIVQCVETKIEIGHRASLRTTPTKEGFTHDWTVYVRGQDRCNISHFVEKVVFHLHHTFSNPRRVVKKSPYYVSEVGYASFDLPIEIFFKSKKEPRKIMFNYDLFLQMYEPVSSVRVEKLTFQKPTDEFKEKLINAGGVVVLPPGETQFADLRGPPTNTESANKQKQPLTSKENLSKQMLNFSGNEKSSNSGTDISASLKSSVKQEKIDNKSKDHDAALSKRSISLSKTVPDPSPLPSRKRSSDSPIPSANKQKRARRSSSMSSERVGSEDKQRSEEKQNKDKAVKHKSSEKKDDSQSKYKDGKDCHKMDTSKQKSSKNSKEKKKESKLKISKVSKSDDKKEAKDDKTVVRDGISGQLMDDNKDINNDTKDVKHGSKVNKDKKEEMDGKKEVQNDKIKVKSKAEVNNDKQEVIYDKKEIKNDRKDVKDDRKGHKEVKADKNGVKEVKDDKKIKEVKNDKQELKTLHGSLVKKSQDSVKHLTTATSKELKEDLYISIDSSSESDDDFWGEINGSDPDMVLDISPTSNMSKTFKPIYSKSALKTLMDELEETSADDEDDITDTVDVFSQHKSTANYPLVESGTVDLDVKQKLNETKLNEERIKDTKEANSKENITCNVVTEDKSSSEQAPNGEELSRLEDLKTTLMGLTDLSVLEKVVKLILSTGFFEVKDTFDFDLCALDLNTIKLLQSFVATKT